MKKALGNRGEEIAAGFLKKMGYRILERNFAVPSGEIDIVARDGETVVFVEVKTRRDDLYGSPAEAVGGRKQRRMRSAALHYLSRLKAQPPARFDIVGVHMGDGREEVEHIKDAFEADSNHHY